MSGLSPSANIGVWSDVFAHCAMCMNLRSNEAQQLIGASSILLVLPSVRLDPVCGLERFLRSLGLPASRLLQLVREGASPYKGEAWDEHWARAVEHLEQLAAKEAAA